MVFGGVTYIPLQTASDCDWIFQVISRYILLKDNHYFIEWAWNENSNPRMWRPVQKTNWQGDGKSLSPPPSSSQGLQPSPFDRNRNQCQPVLTCCEVQGCPGRDRPCPDTAVIGPPGKTPEGTRQPWFWTQPWAVPVDGPHGYRRPSLCRLGWSWNPKRPEHVTAVF